MLSMNDPAVIDDGFPDDSWVSPRERFLGRMAWVILAGLGFLVFDLTAHPSLGVAVFCLKFGLDRFKTAFWLLRKDPHQKRGRVCFLVYASSGCLKICWASILFLILASLAQNWIAPAQVAVGIQGIQPMLIELRVAAIIMASGLAASFTLGLIGVAAAQYLKMKIWMSSSVDRARKAGSWPPYDFARGIVEERNSFEYVIRIVQFISSVFFVISIGAFSAKIVMAIKDHLPLLINTILMILILLFITITLLHRNVYHIQEHMAPVLAERPEDCWFEAE